MTKQEKPVFVVNEETDTLVENRYRSNHSMNSIATEAELNMHTVKKILTEKGILNQDFGKINPRKPKELKLPKKGEVKRYIFTCAQNDTAVYTKVWNALRALSEHYDAEIFVSSFNYNKQSYGRRSVKRGKYTPAKSKKVTFDPLIEDYLNKSDKTLRIAPGLIWCGEMNLSPTLQKPLTGFETYTGNNSGIFPHPKLALDSIPTSKISDIKMNFTTGTVTQINYIQKGAGMKAEHFHSYGGLLVEVLSDGTWFARQLCVTQDGELQDLDILIKDSEIVNTKASVEAINWGDIHVGEIDEDVAYCSWQKSNKKNMLDSLNPNYQFMHDTLNFHSKNHHDIGKKFRNFYKHYHKISSVEEEIDLCIEFLEDSYRKGCKTIVVESNHDNALKRWVEDIDIGNDPENDIFHLECMLEVLKSIKRGDMDFHLFEWACHKRGLKRNIKFLKKRESFVICKKKRNRPGILSSFHGHAGFNGARGTPTGFTKLGVPANIGHFHSAKIDGHLYIAGCSCKLIPHYSSGGPSSWSHSHIVTYPNGKRTIVTIKNRKWRA